MHFYQSYNHKCAKDRYSKAVVNIDHFSPLIYNRVNVLRIHTIKTELHASKAFHEMATTDVISIPYLHVIPFFVSHLKYNQAVTVCLSIKMYETSHKLYCKISKEYKELCVHKLICHDKAHPGET